MKRGWFGPKRWGWGASPASWEGWAVTGAFVLAMGLTGYFLGDTTLRWMMMLVEVALLRVVILLTFDKNARTRV